MSLEQLRASLAKTKHDQTIQDKLKPATPPEDVVSIAKKHGHELTADKICQLIEDELEGMAGGGLWFIYIANPIASAVVTIAAC